MQSLRKEWFGFLQAELAKFSPLLHGSVFYGIDDENSDLDISVEGEYDQVLSVLKARWSDAKYHKVKNGKRNLEMVPPGVQLKIDISFTRPTALFYQETLKLFIERPEIAPILKKAFEARETFSYKGLTKYRIMWLLRLWRTTYPDEPTCENFAKFIKVNLHKKFVVDFVPSPAGYNLRIVSYYSSILGIKIENDDVFPYAGKQTIANVETFIQHMI